MAEEEEEGTYTALSETQRAIQLKNMQIPMIIQINNIQAYKTYEN